MTVRSYKYVPCVALIAFMTLGCAGEFEAHPLSYSKSKLVTDIKDADKQEAVVRGLAELFGPSPREIKVPEGLAVRAGGRYLANFEVDETGGRNPIVVSTSEDDQIVGGYGLYRKHCLHCHGVSGDGAGPTADYLYPRPRDYRKGTYKFTSTTAGAKPSHDDLWKSINYGLHGTSMPGFEALMTPLEIEQVIDYVVFLSIRGETEILMAQDVADGAWDEEIAADKGASPATDWYKQPLNSKIYPKALETAKTVSDKWAQADSQVQNTPKPRLESTNDSILRGRELFLGKTTERLECWGCHGLQGIGNGKSFVDKRVFEKVMFAKHVYQAVNTDEDRAIALIQSTAERFSEVKDERAARLAAYGIGHGHSSGHAGDHSPLDGWLATITTKSSGGATQEVIQEKLSHEFPGLQVALKLDDKAEQPALTITPKGSVKPQLVEDVTPGIRHALLAALSGVTDTKGWVITYSGQIEIPAEATDSQKKLAEVRSQLLAGKVREQLLEDFPGSQVNIVLTTEAPTAEIEVVPMDSANSGSTNSMTTLVSDSANLVKSYFNKVQTDWTGSMDDWQWPLRPANLNTGTYKGGRRPIDIYWRIAKGINGAKMPAHETTLKPDQIWDLVNFVMAVPNRPELLRDATEPVRNDAPKPPQVANR